MGADTQRQLNAQRSSLLRRLERQLEMPMVVLGLAWLLLLVLEFTRGLSPFLSRVGILIWAVFVLDFLLRLVLAPHKLVYLRHNFLTLLALVVPALRLFRVFRAVRFLRLARTARGIRLVRLLTSWNRAMRALGRTLRRRGFGYVMLVTLLVLVSGAAGMYAFEREAAPDRFADFGTALWWTAMILTTMGSEYWPQTAEGRLLCLILAVYGFTIFGYVTATLATFFVTRDVEDTHALAALKDDIAGLRAELRGQRITPSR